MNVNAEKLYDLSTLVVASGYPRAFLRQQLKAGRIKHSVIGKGNGKRYFIKGENYIDFLTRLEDGSFQ